MLNEQSQVKELIWQVSQKLKKLMAVISRLVNLWSMFNYF